MPKDFDELLPKDRSFVVRGVTFHYLDLTPEDVFSPSEVENGAGPWDISDLQILRFLPPDEHEAWKALRADKENPVTIPQINGIFSWLWEEATGLPLPQPEVSGAGAGKTATSSSGKSR